MKREHARQLRRMIEQLSVTLTDEEALQGVELFPMWHSGWMYLADMRVQYNGVLYKCVQAHTSQDDWTPDITPALWVIVSVDEWPEWVQPAGAHDAYPNGAKVSHNGKHWTSDIDANIYEPGVACWTEVFA